MNEELVDAPAQEAGAASPKPPGQRRRRRRRGRGGSGGQQAQAEGADRPEKAEAKKQGGAPRKSSGTKAAADKTEGSEQKSSSARRRRRRRSGGGSKPGGASGDGKSDEPKGQKAKADEPKDGKAKADRPKRSGGKKPAAEKDAGKGDGKADQSEQKSSRSRSRRRRRGAGGTGEERPATKRAEKPAAATATRTRSRKKAGGRRRPQPVRVERRTDKLMLITEHGDRDQIAVIEERDLMEHYVTRKGSGSMVGNIYLGKVQNVLPGMEAAFVDIGRGRNAVLYAGEVSYDEDVEGEERRIEQALKPGQNVVVQVTKDPMGGKGARLTGQASLPGRYLVLVPDGGASGISRRLPDKERARLREIIKKVRPKKAGVIVRTAAEGASAEDLEADLERLKKSWESIRRKSKRGRAPRPLYEEPELTLRVVRDVFSPTEFEKIVTDSKPIYDKILAYLEDISPELVDRLELHAGKLSAFEEHHVTEQIHKALERKVWLSSGGYLIIDRSEAMTIIDVNTGKHVGKSNLEETVTQTNVEAAKEIARQLRLRDIGGIIVIDFIDMLLERNQGLVIKTLKEELAHDRTRSQVFDITPLGLLEMTRKRVSAGLVEAFSETCPTCEGRGILLTHEI